MSELLNLILRKASEAPHRQIFDDFVCGNRAFLMALAQSMYAHNQLDDALFICEEILRREPKHPAATRLYAKILGAKGLVIEAIRRLRGLQGHDDNYWSEVVEEIRLLMNEAVVAINAELAAGRIKAALALNDALLVFYPDMQLLLQSAIDLAERLGDSPASLKYQAQLLRVRAPAVAALDDAVAAAYARGDYEEELRCRAEIFFHPEDAQRNPVLRLQNVNAALSRIMTSDTIDEAKIALAKKLIAGVESIPKGYVEGAALNQENCFEKFWRCEFEAMNLDAVFGPPLDLIEEPKLTYATLDGKALSLEDVGKLAKKNKTEAVFFSAASVAYFGRYARHFAASVLKAADCNFLVMICISGGKGRLREFAKDFGLDDPRIILCADELDENPGPYEVFEPRNVPPGTFPGPYYASIGLLALPYLLPVLKAPIFTTGIDTLLQRGVRDLLEDSREVDVVLNFNTSSIPMESRYTNSLVLTNPTEGGMLFGRFLNNYLGTVSLSISQPGFFDQLALLAATHHVKWNMPTARFKHFDHYDMNNVMFEQGNYAAHREMISKFRFINIFSGGFLSERAVRPEDIT